MSQHAMFAKGRLKQGVMNKTEAEYAQELELLKRAGEIIWYSFEGMKFRLADGCFYTPDFAVMLADGTVEIHEVKGFMMGDAHVKLKVAAAMYPFRFIAIRKMPKRDGGGWKTEEF